MRCVKDNLKLENPLRNDEKYDFYCLTETHGSNEAHDREKFENYFMNLIDRKLCADSVMATNKSQFNSIWELRESIPVALGKDGYAYKYDISLPLNCMYKLVEDMRERLKGSNYTRWYYFKMILFLILTFKMFLIMKSVGYGHLGDGNLHLNITSTKYDQDLYNTIEPFVFEW
jgi:(R)-2-hydroxyglutarate---pyruvate transhydrogenase